VKPVTIQFLESGAGSAKIVRRCWRKDGEKNKGGVWRGRGLMGMLLLRVMGWNMRPLGDMMCRYLYTRERRRY